MTKHTDTSMFLLRGLGLIPKEISIDSSQLSMVYGYLNSYIKDVDHETVLDRPIYLLFKPKDITIFGDFVEEQYIDGNLKEDYDYPNGYTVLLYEFPKRFLNDYFKIMNGEYSKVSEEYKSLFPKKNNFGQKILARAVMDKDEDLRNNRVEEFGYKPGEWNDEWELWKMFEVDKETLNINEILLKDEIRSA